MERLNSIKAEHENWVRTSLSGFDAAKQQDDERWAAYIEEWTSMLDLRNWRDRTYPLLQATPYVRKTFFNRLRKVTDWTVSRVWPTRYPEIRGALTNFHVVANDLVNVFEEHSEEDDSRYFRTRRFYKIPEWNPELYDLLLRRFEFHVDLIQDLTCEMTRAANYVCDNVRKHLDGSFRIKEGLLLVTRGMGMDLKEYTYRLEYQPEERTHHPYKGLNEFLQDRALRDFHVGTGEKP